MEDIEIWKDIIGFEGIYKISSKGRVLSIGNSASRKDKFLKHWKYGDYVGVDLYKNGRSHKKYVHRLVALHFIDNPENLPNVNHKDHDRLNYSINNLEWCSQDDNALHGKRKAKTVHNLRMQVLIENTHNYILKYNLNLDVFISEMTKPSK